MHVSKYNSDGTVSLTQQHGNEMHHFLLPLSDLTAIGGGISALLATPPMPCIDADCTYTAQSFFPLLGDLSAQWIHVYWAIAAASPPGSLTQGAAIAQVQAAISAVGGVLRIWS